MMPYLRRLLHDTGVRRAVTGPRGSGQPTAATASSTIDTDDVREIGLGEEPLPQVGVERDASREEQARVRDLADSPSSGGDASPAAAPAHLGSDGEPVPPRSRSPRVSTVPPAAPVLSNGPVSAEKESGVVPLRHPTLASVEQAEEQNNGEAASQSRWSTFEASGPGSSGIGPGTGEGQAASARASGAPGLPPTAPGSPPAVLQYLPEVVAWVDEGPTPLVEGSPHRPGASRTKHRAVSASPPLAGQGDDPVPEAPMFALHIGTIELTVEDPITPIPVLPAPQSTESAARPDSARVSRLTRHYLRG
jgi:hypothetical protein